MYEGDNKGSYRFFFSRLATAEKRLRIFVLFYASVTGFLVQFTSILTKNVISLEIISFLIQQKS